MVWSWKWRFRWVFFDLCCFYAIESEWQGGEKRKEKWGERMSDASGGAERRSEAVFALGEDKATDSRLFRWGRRRGEEKRRFVFLGLVAAGERRKRKEREERREEKRKRSRKGEERGEGRHWWCLKLGKDIWISHSLITHHHIHINPNQNDSIKWRTVSILQWNHPSMKRKTTLSIDIYKERGARLSFFLSLSLSISISFCVWVCVKSSSSQTDRLCVKNGCAIRLCQGVQEYGSERAEM